MTTRVRRGRQNMSGGGMTKGPYNCWTVGADKLRSCILILNTVTFDYVAVLDHMHCIASSSCCRTFCGHQSDCRCRCRDLAESNSARSRAERTVETFAESGG